MLKDAIIKEIEAPSRRKKAAGYLSIHVPEEIIIAAGRMPFRILGRGKPVRLATAYLPKTFDPHVLDSLEGALEGDYPFLEGVIIANVSDAHRRLYDAWRCSGNTMEVFFLDVPKGSDRLRLRAFQLALTSLLKDMERAFKVKVSHENLRKAIDLCNETRTLLRRVNELRKGKSPPVSGQDFFEIVLWSQTHEKHQVNKTLREILKGMDGKRGKTIGPRMMLTGGLLSSSRLISLIERLGARVVCEDLCIGMQYFSGTVDTEDQDPLRALARRYLSIPSARMVDTEARWNYLLRTVEEFHVDGIIYFALKFDDIYLFEYPYLRNKFQKAGYPTLFIEAENFLTNVGQIETRIQAFIEMLG